MMSDEEVQKYARKSAILIAKMKDGTYKVLFLLLRFLQDYRRLKKAF